MDRWLTGYTDKLRPRLLLGRFRSATSDSTQFQAFAEATLGDRMEWAWGGDTGAFRLVPHYRTEGTTIHVDEAVDDVRRRLNLLPADKGPVVLLALPGPLALEGAIPRVAHPLLLYSELLAAGDDRAREAAIEIRNRYLRHLA
jgi:hypothetical protein